MCDMYAVCVRCGDVCLCGVAVCGVQSLEQRSQRGGSEGTGVVSGRSDGSADAEVRGMSAMGAGCGWSAWCVRDGLHGVWERWEYERGCVGWACVLCGFCVCVWTGRDVVGV